MKFYRQNFKIKSHFSHVNGQTIHYLSCGRGKPLIFLHAYLSTAQTFRGVIKYLAKYYRVYAPDFPGFGLSDEVGGNPTLEESSRLLAAWIKKENLRDFILSGVSMGGVVAVYLAKEIDESVKGYVLIEPYYGLKTLLFPKGIVRTIRGLAIFFDNFLPLYLGEKLWSSKETLISLLTWLNPLRSEVEKKRPLKQKLDVLVCATYKTFWHTLNLLLHLDLNKERVVSKKSAVLVMSRADESLDYQKTLRGFKKLFPNLKEIPVELSRHYPVETITVRYLETHYSTLLEKIVGSFT